MGKVLKLLSLTGVPLLFICSIAVGQVTVSGTVTDFQSGETLPGVNVVIKGTTQGTSTDVDGNYELNVPSLQDTLVFSFVGYQTQEIAINGRTQIDVELQTQAVTGEDLVVVGYGSVERSDLTGSVSSVLPEEFNSFPNPNVLEGLSGRTAGVQVATTTGAPGGGLDVRIRGNNSILGGSEPLYVVDGFPLSGQPTNLNNSDIKSVEVLKDASATAIYGSRGANGVVIIETKEGNQGPIQVDFESSFTTQKIINKLELMNASEYATLANIQARNDGVDPFFSQEEIDNFGEGTNWQERVFESAPITQGNLNIHGGNETTQYSVGGSFYKEEGIVDGSDFNRFTIRSKLNQSVGEKFDFDLSLNLSKQITRRKNESGGARGGSLFNAAITAPPIADPFNSDGSINDISQAAPFVVPDIINPFFFINEEDDKLEENIILANAGLSFKINPNITLRSTLGIESEDSRTDFFRTREFLRSDGVAEINTGQSTSLLSENTINYRQNLGENHQFDVLAGFSFQNFVDEGLSALGSGFLSNTFRTGSLEAASSLGIPNSDFTKSTLLSSFARINYDFNNKYLVTFTIRGDGSSRFAEGEKWGVFPSGAVAWKVNQEDFFRNNEFISSLKIRASWGLTGNQAIQPFSTLNRLQSGNAVFGNSLNTSISSTSTLPADLKWEVTDQKDIGLDIGFLNNRFLITADYFLKNTRDLLNDVRLPSSTGFINTIRNIGKVRNSGFEITLDANEILSSDKFSWDINANASFLDNEVKRLAGGEDIPTNFVGLLIISDNVSILQEGKPIGQFWGFVEDGFTDQGQIKFKDLNGDGEITAEGDKTSIGNPNPDVIFGLTSNFQYKNFSLTTFLQGTIGNDIFNASSAPSTLDFGQGLNMPKEVLTKRWTPENPENAKFPKISRQVNAEVSDRFVEDGSFLRVKNVELAYNIPIQSFGEKVRDLEVYVSGQNILTITNYSWWDPEVNSRGLGTQAGVDLFSFPNTKSVTIGIRGRF